MEEKFTYFYSIGEKQAKKLIEKLLELKLLDRDKVKQNDYSISELKKILKNPLIYESLSAAIKADLTYNPIRKIRRSHIEKIDQEIKNQLGPKKDKFIISGSYMRQKTYSSDLDIIILINWEEFKSYVNKSKLIYFIEPFAVGENKITTLLYYRLLNIYVKTDIFITKPEHLLFTLLYVTGSGLFNLRMRSQAKRKGYILNQYGLFKEKNKEPVPVKSEKEIFEILGMTYLEPYERTK